MSFERILCGLGKLNKINLMSIFMTLKPLENLSQVDMSYIFITFGLNLKCFYDKKTTQRGYHRTAHTPF